MSHYKYLNCNRYYWHKNSTQFRKSRRESTPLLSYYFCCVVEIWQDRV